MKIWKTIPVLMILFLVGGCAEATTESPDSKDGEKPAEKPAPAPASKPADKPAEKPVAAAPATVTIPAGTKLTILMDDTLNSGKNEPGDAFKGELAAPVMVNGKTALAKGAAVQGKVVDAKGSGRVKGVASMSVTLTSVTVGGKAVALTTSTFAQEAEAQKGKDAAIVGGGAGLGTAIGAIAGGGKGAATGAIIGGAAGAGTVLATKGKEVEFKPEDKLEFALSKDLTVTP
jgi:hypothetical protein